MMGRRTVAWLVMVFSVAFAADAQVGASRGEASGAREDLARATASRIVRSAVLLTRRFADPALEEFRIGALVMRFAEGLDPTNEELLRLELEAWRLAQDEEESLRLTRELVRLNPRDTVAQLRLITHRVGKLQRIEDRLGAYENLLGPGGSSLDASVRSRLAFDAAMLHRELGNEADFLGMLEHSLTLDQTNKPAALLASALFFDRVTDPMSRAEMHTQLILSDPFDFAAHQAFAAELLKNGAYKGAERFLDNAAALRSKRGVVPDEELLNLYYTVGWGTRGADAFLAELAEDEATALYVEDINRRAAEEAGEDPESVPRFESSPIEDRFRALMSGAVGEREAALRFFDRMSSAMGVNLSGNVEAGRVSAEQAAEITRRLLVESIRLRAWIGIDLGGAERTLNQVVGDETYRVRQESIDRYRGLIAAHRGDVLEAHRLLDPLVTEGDRLAEIGVAILAEGSGNLREAAGRYARVLKVAPGSAEGLWSRERLEALLGAPVREGEVAARLNTLAGDAPRQLERMISDPSEHLSLSVRLADDALEPFSPILARVDLKNRGVFPLAVGNDRPVASRVVISPKLVIGGAPVDSVVSAEFVSLARRIRLAPGETVSAGVWLDAGPLGAVVESTVPLASSLRVQAIQGYVYTDSGSVYSPDGFSLETGSGVVWHRPAHPSPSAEEIIDRFNAAVGGELPLTMLEAQWLLSQQPKEESGEGVLVEQQTALMNALAARYSSMTHLERAYLLLGIPGAWNLPLGATLDEVALAAEPSSITTLALLLTRVTGSDSPALAMGLEDHDPTVREIAEIMKLRFEIIERAGAVQDALNAQSEPNPSR